MCCEEFYADYCGNGLCYLYTKSSLALDVREFVRVRYEANGLNVVHFLVHINR